MTCRYCSPGKAGHFKSRLLIFALIMAGLFIAPASGFGQVLVGVLPDTTWVDSVSNEPPQSPGGEGSQQPLIRGDKSGGSVDSMIISGLDCSGFPTICFYADALDISGIPVGGLAADSFCVYQDGNPINSFTIQELNADSCHTSVCLVVDVSGSMSDDNRLDSAKAAMHRFVDNMDPFDRVAIVSFSTCVTTEIGFTSDTAALHAAISGLSANGYTAVFDGIWEGVNITTAELGSKAVIAFTDGLENRSQSCWPPPDGINDHSYADDSAIIVNLANGAGIPIYTFNLGPIGYTWYNPQALQAFANGTGGFWSYAPTGADIDSVYNQIKERLCSRYYICYESLDTVQNGDWHTTTVCYYNESEDLCGPCDSAACQETDVPEIDITPPTVALSDTCQPDTIDLQICTYVTDADTDPGDLTVRLFYRTQAGSYTDILMTLQVDDSTFCATIPASTLSGKEFFEYYITASDGEATVSNPATNPQTSPYHIDICFNEPPVASCPGNDTLFVCNLDEICIAGFSCADPDDNLASCIVSPGSLNGDTVCFTPGEGVNTITLIATDDDGAADTCQTIIYVFLNDPPVISCPVDLTIECDASTDPSNTGYATATDDHDPSPAITYSDSEVAGSCPQEKVITRTWYAVDDCNDTSTCQQTITVEDTTAPVISCPDDTTIECDESIDPSNAGSATATDNCDTSPTVNYADQVNGNVITRTWTATDDCGNSSSCQQTITILDTTPPVISCPADVTIECDESADPSNTGAATATDNCDTGVIITYTDSDATGSCPQEKVITRTWHAEDNNGNYAECVQTITVQDTTTPVIACPGDITLECDQSTDPSNTGTATASDNCGSVTVIYSDNIIPGSCPDNYTIQRTWTATDECDNSSDCMQTITIQDTTPPVITCPSDITIECDESTLPSNTGNASAVDNCDGSPDVTYTDSRNYGVITRTWTATDNCGNSSSCQQTITILDTTPPVINCPTDVTIECDQSTDPSNTGSATAIDNCDTNVTISYTDSETAGSCPQEKTISRTWHAEDDNGNYAECIQTITVEDTTTPVITCPGDITLECDQSTDPSNTGSATASDNCGAVTVTYSDNIVSGNCPDNYTIQRTWTATDECNNSSDCVQTITVQDTTPPAVTCPSDITIECDESMDPSNTGSPTATDNCGSVTFSYSDSTVAGDCAQESIVYRTWTAEDECGNSSSCAQVITVEDSTPPVITCPDNITIECSASTDPSNTGSATAVDNCDVSPAVAYSDQVNGNVITRTWTATDACGNDSDCLQTITLIDTSPPTITCPNDIAVECDESTDPSSTGTATADDNCDPNPAITYTDSTVAGDCPQEYTIIRTWRATDAGNNYSECQQSITVEDTTPPVITCPEDAEIYCDGPYDPSITDTATAADNCDPSPVITYTDQINGNVVTRTWTATDSCGNSSGCQQLITLVPNDPPQAACPSDTTIFMCELTEICIGGLQCSDPDDNLASCEAIGGTLDGDEICFTPVEGENTLMLIATDDCGAADTCTTVVTVILNNPPTATCPGEIDTSLCELEQLCIPGFSCSDIDYNLASCNAVTGTLNGDEICFMPVEGMNYLILLATDACGATTACTTMVNVTLNSPPVAECPGSASVSVYEFPADICIHGFGCSDPDGNLVSCEVDVVPGSNVVFEGDSVCFTADAEGYYTVTITATDECGAKQTTDQCQTSVFVRKLTECPVVQIEKTHGSLQGHLEHVSITYTKAIGQQYEMGGFDFLIAYDASALTFMEAERGQLLEDCGWEYFTYRYGFNGNCGDACPSGLLRIVALAEDNNGPLHPSCFGPPDEDPHELAEMTFLVTSDMNFESQYVPIYFFWADCGDNIISSKTGDTAFIDSKIYDFENGLIWDENDDSQFPEDARIPFLGAPDDCLNPIPDKPSAIRCVEFVNGGIDIIPVENLDDRGDVNLNGVCNEIADAIVFTNYFIFGPDAFTVNFEGQKAATDVNADGITLTVADLVYMIRIIVGDALPIPKVAPNIYAEFESVDGAINVDSRLGAALMVLEGEANVSLGSDAMDMEIISRFDGTNTRVLLYSFDRGHACSGEILRTSANLLSVEAADYDGNAYKATLIPNKFSVTCYPNPFNPTTTIEMTLPTASDWSVSIINVMGQKIAEFSGYGEAGPVRISWDASQYASGVYFYKATAAKQTVTRKMMLLK